MKAKVVSLEESLHLDFKVQVPASAKDYECEELVEDGLSEEIAKYKPNICITGLERCSDLNGRRQYLAYYRKKHS